MLPMRRAPTDGTVIEIRVASGDGFWLLGRRHLGKWREIARGSRIIHDPLGWRPAYHCPNCKRPIELDALVSTTRSPAAFDRGDG